MGIWMEWFEGTKKGILSPSCEMKGDFQEIEQGQSSEEQWKSL